MLSSERCFRVAVVADDLEQGVRGNPKACAVAVAIRRELGVLSYVTCAYIQLAGRPSYTTSPALADWIWTFDQTRSASPIEIEFRGQDRLVDIAVSTDPDGQSEGGRRHRGAVGMPPRLNQ